jgi:hypothetical protein
LGGWYIPLHSDAHECGQAGKQGPLVRVDRGKAIILENPSLAQSSFRRSWFHFLVSALTFQGIRYRVEKFEGLSQDALVYGRRKRKWFHWFAR